MLKFIEHFFKLVEGVIMLPFLIVGFIFSTFSFGIALLIVGIMVLGVLMIL
jgi:hypothetical protein